MRATTRDISTRLVVALSVLFVVSAHCDAAVPTTADTDRFLEGACDRSMRVDVVAAASTLNDALGDGALGVQLMCGGDFLRGELRGAFVSLGSESHDGFISHEFASSEVPLDLQIEYQSSELELGSEAATSRSAIQATARWFFSNDQVAKSEQCLGVQVGQKDIDQRAGALHLRDAASYIGFEYGWRSGTEVGSRGCEPRWTDVLLQLPGARSFSAGVHVPLGESEGALLHIGSRATLYLTDSDSV